MANKKLKVGNVPHLRFPGFTGEWEVKKLGEIAAFSNGKGHEKDIDENGIYILVNSKFVSTDGNVIKRTNKQLIPLFCNQIVMVMSDLPNGKALAKCFYIDNNNLYTLNQRICSLTINEDDSKFIYYSINRNEFYLKFDDGVNQTNLKKAEVLDCPVYLPSLSKHQKIASFLSLNDERNQTQIKIIEQLKTLIKGLSEKLFSQEIRFKGFIEKWAVKKLGEIFYSEKGRGLSKDKLVSNGQYECVLYGELYTKYKEVIFDVVSKTNEEDGLKSQIGDLLIPSSTTTTGIDLANVTAINKENVLLGGDITVLRSEEKINNIFYAYYLSNYKKEEIASYAQGSTIVHLYYNHMKNMLIDLPSFEEQTAIANFLSAIDTKIQTEKNILDKYQSQKQYLLQNLFI